MKYLNLQENSKLSGPNQVGYESFTFKGGEPHIKIDPSTVSKEVSITTRINSFNDIGLLMVTVDALRRIDSKIELVLSIPYFPGARQDRVMVNGEPLTVKVYADIINSLNFSSVQIFDPHSDVTPVLLNNVHVVDNHKFILKVLQDIYPQRNSKTPILISPDAGSNKKINKLTEYLSVYNVVDVVKCDKTRNVKTGQITGFEVYSGDLKGRDALIVDDICDGGGTFIGLAKKLKEKNVGKLYLAVSHGIFSQGFKTLNQEFEMIYTTNSVKDYNQSYIESHNHHLGFVPKIKEIPLKLVV